MRVDDRDAAVLPGNRIDRRSHCEEVAVNDPVLLMRLEMPLPPGAVRKQIIYAISRSFVDSSAKLPNFVFKVALVRRVFDEIELHLFPVDMAVQVHAHALRAAAVKRGKNAENANGFVHLLYLDLSSSDLPHCEITSLIIQNSELNRLEVQFSK